MMKLYVPGRESQKRVTILLKMTKIQSVNVIAAVRGVLVNGWSEELASEVYDVDGSNLKRALSRINEIIGYHNQLNEER